jgi:hypothetical protein
MTIITTTTAAVTVDVADLLANGTAARHPASGALHAIGGTLPTDAMMDPVAFSFFRSYRTKLAANLTRYNALGLQLVPVLSDDFGYVHTYFPGDGGYSWAAWDTWVTTYVGQLVSTGIQPWAIDIWNEPDLTEFWPRTFAQFCDMWTRAAAKIKALQPTWKVVGPSLSKFDVTLQGQFFAACQTAGVLPDVLSVHQLAIPYYALEEPWNFPTRLAALVAQAATYGITGKPFFLGEYVSSGLDITRPGQAAAWMVSMHAAGLDAVAGACHSVFTEQDYTDPLLNTGDGISNGNRDTLCGILAPDQSPRAKWFLYRDYARMQGKMASDLTAAILVCGNPTAREVSAIYCAKDPASRRQSITFTNMGSAFSPGRVQFSLSKYQDSAWAKCNALPIVEYGTVLSGFNSITMRLPPFAAGTEAIHIRLAAR